jgi:hypothetical protein
MFSFFASLAGRLLRASLAFVVTMVVGYVVGFFIINSIFYGLFYSHHSELVPTGPTDPSNRMLLAAVTAGAVVVFIFVFTARDKRKW